VVRRSDLVGVPTELRGAGPVAEETRGNMARAVDAVAVLVDGRIGVVVAPAGHLAVAIRLTIVAARITAIDIVTDPARLAALDLALPQP
jgi:RNA polymerase sigma-70 factor (ECF subfamily)